MVMVIKYYDIYDYNGVLVDFTDNKWWAEEIASEHCGYYIERVEELEVDLDDPDEFQSIVKMHKL